MPNTDARGPTRSQPAGSAYGRGRPKAETVSQISTAIIEAATDIFLARGYEETSMEAVATRAGVTKVTLYKRFPDKRGLLQAVLRARRPEWASFPPLSGRIEARLKQLASTILVSGVSPELRAFHALATSAWPKPSDMTAREEVLGYNDMLRRLESEIREGAKELGIASSRPATVALALMAMLSGWFEHRTPDPDRDADDADEFARSAIELLVRGKAAW